MLGVSDQMAARRYARLRETAGLRVVGRLNPRPVHRAYVAGSTSQQ